MVGIGAGKGIPVAEVLDLIGRSLRGAGLSPGDVVALATVDTKAGEPGIAGAAALLGVPLRAYPAAQLARIAVPHPSAAALAAAGTPSVAEAAALAGGGELLVPKRKSAPDGGAARVTCAVAEERGRSVTGMDMMSAVTVDNSGLTRDSGPHGEAPGPPVAFGGSPVTRGSHVDHTDHVYAR
ncbi:cobalamin biosynthesis protein [Streptomyces sp. NPDC088725]|uniref:cobalamin biosynthesis protein n=1 Tax=Streptomyces sp. NPDC088725 TaxID=3365873 RepID=UPI0038164076